MERDNPYPSVAIAADVPPPARPSNYPAAIVSLLAEKLAGRKKRRLGDHFGLRNFGVNLTSLAPNAASSLRHAHSRQDELVYVLQGFPALFTDAGTTRLAPGMCAGFRAGTGNAHALVNDTTQEVVFLEIGDRTPQDEVVYPDHDLLASFDGARWTFRHKDGSPY